MTNLTRQQKRYVFIWLPALVLGVALLVISQFVG